MEAGAPNASTLGGCCVSGWAILVGGNCASCISDTELCSEQLARYSGMPVAASCVVRVCDAEMSAIEAGR